MWMNGKTSRPYRAGPASRQGIRRRRVRRFCNSYAIAGMLGTAWSPADLSLIRCGACQISMRWFSSRSNAGRQARRRAKRDAEIDALRAAIVKAELARAQAENLLLR